MTLMAISVAIFVLLGIEQIRQQARDSFASTVSGVDLIVGAKTGSLNLLLYSVFRIGSPTDNISWQAYREIADSDDVAWAIPISLGDSHEGYRVVGTTQAFFEHFSFGKKRRLAFSRAKYLRVLSTPYWAQRWHRLWVIPWGPRSFLRTAWQAPVSPNTTISHSLL